MNGLKKKIKKNKKAVLIGGLLVCMFLTFSTINAVHVNRERHQETQQETVQKTEASPSPAVTNTQDGESDANLTDQQKKLIDGYDTETKRFIETLSREAWARSEGEGTLRFTGTHTYTEVVNGQPIRHDYAISRLDQGVTGTGGSGATIVFETDDGTHIVNYREEVAADVPEGQEPKTTLSSQTMFRNGELYERVTTPVSVTIKDMDESATTFMGDVPAIEKALTDYCTYACPKVTEATWKQEIKVDFKEHTAVTGFTVNTETNMSVDVTYHQDTGTYEVGN